MSKHLSSNPPPKTNDPSAVTYHLISKNICNRLVLFYYQHANPAFHRLHGAQLWFLCFSLQVRVIHAQRQLILGFNGMQLTFVQR